ncbi:DUF2334 domain-containing protein [Halomarina oriensis]|uniref:DUF2334 domain-containing protein n=1 Tax=Halomarina oriensis TaxID=671145 RepID=A0A6B0GSQ1_9EURY|nr:DUF2334 domain-containing protein [Halomarina oriensis]MWG35663.1 DUF2334 domain-containing protein [Halomarina oriensis]
MTRQRGPREDQHDDIRPEWGNWSVGRASAWSVLGAVVVLLLAGVATGGVGIPDGVLGDAGSSPAAGPGAVPTHGTEDVDGPAERAVTTTPETPPEWHEYDAVVVFRNDDIQPYYRTETMVAVDRIFVEEGIPVTLGVVPQVGNGAPITDTDLCPYLRSLERDHPGQFEMALHGYTHEQRTDFYGGSEFGGLDPATQRAYIDSGTRTLTECVGERPTTFVPPMDTYDGATVDALRAANYTVVSGGGSFTAQYYDETEPFERDGLLHVPNDGGFVANWSTGAFHDADTLERRYDWAVEDGEIYVQMLHYQDFTTEERRAQLRAYIQYVKASGDVRFMTLGELDEHTRNGTIEKTEDGWRVYE